MKKRIISFLLSLCMVWSLLPGAAWAEETNSVPSSAPSTIEVQQSNENQQPNDGSQSEVDSQPNGASQSEVDQQSNEGGKAVADSNGTTVQVNDGKAVIIRDNLQTEYDTLDGAMDAASSGDTIYLGAGTYCGNATSPTTAGKGAGKSLTFVGAGTDETTWQIRALDNPTSSSDGPCDYSFDGSDSITFQNMTIVGSVYPNGNTKHSDQSYLQGFARIQNITLESCTFNGMAGYWGYKTTTFKDVIFNAPGTTASGTPNDVDYSLWTYTGESYTFESCTFNSTGKTIKVYRHGTSTNVTIDYKNCTVNSTNIKYKPVLAINDYTMGDSKYTINISGNNKVEGIKSNAITCSRLFGFDEAGENAGKTIVYIEGEKVWENSGRVGSHNHDFETGSYNNGVATDNANKYTDGYKDDAFTTSYGDWAFNQETGKFTRTVTKTCDYCDYKETTDETKELELDVSRSKTATALDSSNQSTVTLSLPSAEENLVSDVVFVLDGSSSAADSVVTESLRLLSDLKEAISGSDASVNVCVVKFKRQAVKSDWFDLSKEYDEIKTAMESKYSGGTNLHAGLLAGKEALEDHTNVPANRKYMILISDGSTYLYSKDGNWASDTPYTRSYFTMDNYQANAGSFNDQTLYNPSNGGSGYDERNVVRPTTTSDVDAWQKYLADVKARNETVNSEGKTGDDYDYHCNYDLNFNQGIPSDDFKSQPCEGRTANNRDMAFYYADQVWKEIEEAGYNAYSIAEEDGSAGAGNADDSHCFMNYLNGGASLNFSDIENDIFYAVGAGSVVEDKMGADFDFVTGSLKLTVGSKELTSETVDNVTYFGAKEATQAIGKDNYRFKVEYNSTDDKFIWTINENVSNFAPVQLSYKVTLVKPNTAAGTYGQTDLNGDGKVDGTNTDVDPNTALYTNESATLTPTDSEGHQGKPLTFPKPSVSYTVKSSSSGGSSSSSATPSPTPTAAPTATPTAAPETTPTPVVTVTGAIPKTGDDSSVTLWMVLCVASALALGGVSFYSRKKR